MEFEPASHGPRPAIPYQWTEPKPRKVKKLKKHKARNSARQLPTTTYKPITLTDLCAEDKQRIGNLIKELSDEKHKNKVLELAGRENAVEVKFLRRENKHLRKETKHLKEQYHQALYIIESLKNERNLGLQDSAAPQTLLLSQPTSTAAADPPTMLGSQIQSQQSSNDNRVDQDKDAGTPKFDIARLRKEMSEISDSLKHLTSSIDSSVQSSSMQSSTYQARDTPSKSEMRYIQESIGDPLMLESLDQAHLQKSPDVKYEDALFGIIDELGTMPAPPIREELPFRKPSHSSSSSEDDQDQSDDSIDRIKRRANKLRNDL